MDPESSIATDVPVPGLLRSPTIGKLTSALSKAQAEMKAPKKGRTGKVSGTTKTGKDYDYEYGYADLADVIEASRGPLSKNGLAVMQPTIQRDGHVVLMTILAHESGEWIAGELPLPAWLKPQEFGSLMTYYRRYGRGALLDIAAEDDDDGKRAQDAEPRKPEPEPVSADAAAIAILAAELGQISGKVDPETVIKEYSSFAGKDGKVMSFTDPTKVRSAKWLKSTREKLERELHKVGALREAGVDEAADLFTNDAA